MSFDLEATRSRLRLGSALVLLAFVTCHLVAHAFLLVSLDTAEAALNLLMAPWRTVLGVWVLGIAAAIHYANALWSIYLRRSLRLSRWEWWQLALGLTIPALLIHHITAAKLMIAVSGFDGAYGSVLALQWRAVPWLAAVQAAAVIVVWSHAMIGLHFWLRTRPAYPRWRSALRVGGLLLPTLALSGFVAAGNQVLRAPGLPGVLDSGVTEAMIARANSVAMIGWSIHFALVLLPFAARAVRRMIERRKMPPLLTHASGRTLALLPGATVLETLREHGIPHASVCGGRGRCTTCRVLVTKGLDTLAAPGELEAKALTRIAATPGMRLACQIRPAADVAITPLLAADASAADGTVPGGLEGRERLVTVVFVDLRGSTALAEGKLPYDVLFILNQFFHAMTRALAATNGHYSQFTGDGLMALYGLDGDPAAGAADALRGAREMLLRLEQLNHKLGDDLTQPLRIGIGIHFSEAIVGAMGPPNSQIISAIGDTVNTAARLESLTKDYDCALVLSRRAAEAAGLVLGARDLHECAVRGRAETIAFYALKTVPELAR